MSPSLAKSAILIILNASLLKTCANDQLLRSTISLDFFWPLYYTIDTLLSALLFLG